MNKLSFILLLTLISCGSHKTSINNATIFTKVPGLPNQPISKVLTFQVVSKDSLLIDSFIKETKTKQFFKIVSIFNSENVYFENGVKLKPGKYRVEANSINNDFEIIEDLEFQLKINNNVKLLKPLLKPNLLMK